MANSPSEPSDEAAIFSLNAAGQDNQDSDYDTEDPQYPNTQRPGRHGRRKKPDFGDKPMNDPFPPMYLAHIPPQRGGDIAGTSEPSVRVVWTPGAKKVSPHRFLTEIRQHPPDR